MRDTIAVIGANRGQAALVVDNDDRLVGTVTDGDVRRAILKGVSLEAPTAEIMNANPKSAALGTALADIREILTVNGVRQVPIVNDRGTVVDLVTAEDLLRGPILSTPVVLMAGGRGQRLYPLTKDVPKPMLEIGGVPLLEIILKSLRAQGFADVHISVNYHAQVIMDFVGDGSAFGLNVQYVHEDKPLGTAGALSSLQGIITEPFIVMNSDLLTHVNLQAMLAFHDKQRSKATVGVREHVFEIPYGVINLRGSLVESMVEKPLHRSMVNAGIYLLDPLALSLPPSGEYFDMPSLLDRLMADGHDVAAFPIHESWLDVGRPEDLEFARTNSANWVLGE